MAQTKATKKFEKKRLKDVLERRKKFAKVKQKHQIREKKKAKRAAERADEADEEDRPRPGKASNGNAFQKMSVDEFFQGGFEIPKELQVQTKKSDKAAVKTGKRKRDADDEDEDENEPDEEEEIMEQPVEEDGESDAESEDEDEDMQEQLDALAKKDPEFYKHLQEEDPELLEFDADKYAEIDALSDDDEQPKKKQEKDADDDSEEDTAENAVTMAMLDRWEKHMTETHALRHTKEVVRAFKAAAQLSEEGGQKNKYTIPSSEVYNKVLTITLKHLPAVLDHHLPAKESKQGKISIPTDSKAFRTVSPMLKTHIVSLQKLLSTLSDDKTQRLTLNAILPLLPYLVSYKKALRDLVKQVITVWSSTASSEATRISAFLILRRVVVIGDAGTKESVLRSTYQGLLAGARKTTAHTLPAINLMKNSAAELWGLDAHAAYTTAFTFIRQLAIHLRGAIKDTTKNAHTTKSAPAAKGAHAALANWQFAHALDFWSRAVAAQAAAAAQTGSESALAQLLYPLLQVTLGAARRAAAPPLFPLRLQLVRAALRAGGAAGAFVPAAPLLLDVLGSPALRRRGAATALAPLDFEVVLRAPKAYVGSRAFRDGLGEQVVEVLGELFARWAKSVAFPELALPVVVVLKRWLRDVNDRAKGNRNGKVNAAVALLVQKVESNARWIEERRRKVDFAPNNRSAVEAFLKDEDWEKTPLGAFVVAQRKMREERKKVMEEGRRADERKRASEKDNAELDDGEEDEEDEE